MIQSTRLISSLAAASALAALLVCGPAGCKRVSKEKDKPADPAGSGSSTMAPGPGSGSAPAAGSAEQAQPAKPGADVKIGLVFDALSVGRAGSVV